MPPQPALFLFLDSELGEESKHAVRESGEKKVKQPGEKVYHKEVTEIYYILEGRGTMELGDDTVALEPGVALMIDKGTPHRGVGDFKALIIGVPAWHPEDEYFVDE